MSTISLRICACFALAFAGCGPREPSARQGDANEIAPVASEPGLPQAASADAPTVTAKEDAPDVGVAFAGHNRAKPDDIPWADGIVVGLTRDAIQLRPVNGPPVVEYYPFATDLARGRLAPGGKNAYGYKVSDVQLGDEVWITWEANEERVKCCTTISIRKRPGGRVPPPSAGDLAAYYSDRINADNDRRDFGIPVPERLKPKNKIPILTPAEREKRVKESIREVERIKNEGVRDNVKPGK